MADTVAGAGDLTVEEAATRMRTHPETVRRWLRKGLLPHAYKTPSGYGWRIPSGDLDAMRTERGRPMPLTLGIVADGSLPARESEEYLFAPWPAE